MHDLYVSLHAHNNTQLYVLCIPGILLWYRAVRTYTYDNNNNCINNNNVLCIEIIVLWSHIRLQVMLVCKQC